MDTPSPTLDEDDNEDGDESSDEGQDGGKVSSLDKLRKFFSKSLGISDSEKYDGPKKVEKLDLKGVAEYISSGKCKNVILLTGAGISTSAGIPDFRSPGSGLYDNLKKYNLPDPQCIFEISFFKQNPKPFFELAKELYPGTFKPTPCHYFMKLLHEKGVLLRIYTQNIDTLEHVAGVPADKIVEAHGTFKTSHCLKCKKLYSLEWMEEQIFSDVVPTCEDCNSVVKPDVVFFGENLPLRFFTLYAEDFPKCDLLIVMGTSLVVQPFATLIDKVPKDCPRLLINKEKAGEVDPIRRFLGYGKGMSFESKHNYRDIAWLGLCDDGCKKLADLLGWGDELSQLVNTEHQRIDREAKQKPHRKPRDWL